MVSGNTSKYVEGFESFAVDDEIMLANLKQAMDYTKANKKISTFQKTSSNNQNNETEVLDEDQTKNNSDTKGTSAKMESAFNKPTFAFKKTSPLTKSEISNDSTTQTLPQKLSSQKI